MNIRQYLHTIAETSGKEVKTSEFIVEKLKKTNPVKIVRFSKGYHILAEYDFGKSGKTILFRADMDAVSVNENSALEYHSENEGVSHKCGHDGHSTILLSLADKLHKHPLPCGKVLLLFQGAEETGQGAREILDDSILKEYDIDIVYALHNIPGEEYSSIICKSDSFTCSVISCEIMLNGKTAHAAEPWNAVCPYDAAKTITEKVLSLNNHNIENDDFCVATLVEFCIGEKAYGVAAGNGVLRFTIRTKIDERLQYVKSLIENVVEKEISKIDGLQSKISWIEYFAASKNSKIAVKHIQDCANQLNLKYIDKETPFFWGEDFGLFTQKYEGALFGLGSGTHTPPLHHPDFDFPDGIVESGVEMFYKLAETQIDAEVAQN